MFIKRFAQLRNLIITRRYMIVVRQQDKQYMLISQMQLFHMPDIVAYSLILNQVLIEPRCEKTGFLHMRKQRRISAAQ